MALWPYGLRFFLLLRLITQRHYSHPGSTGSMQAAKVRKFAYRLHLMMLTDCFTILIVNREHDALCTIITFGD